MNAHAFKSEAAKASATAAKPTGHPQNAQQIQEHYGQALKSGGTNKGRHTSGLNLIWECYHYFKISWMINAFILAICSSKN